MCGIKEKETDLLEEVECYNLLTMSTEWSKIFLAKD